MVALYTYCVLMKKSFWFKYNAVKLAHILFSPRRKVKRTLHEIYCLHFLPQIILKLGQSVGEHFVIIIEIGMHFWKNPIMDEK